MLAHLKITLLLWNHSRFATENQLKRKGYSEGMEQVSRNIPPAKEVLFNSVQIRNTPEIAPVLGDLEDLPSPAAKSRSSPSTPVVLKKPVKLDCISSPLVMFDTIVEGENAGWLPHNTSEEGS